MKAVSSPLARAIAAARSSADTSRPQARKSVQPETPDGASPMKNRLFRSGKSGASTVPGAAPRASGTLVRSRARKSAFRKRVEIGRALGRERVSQAGKESGGTVTKK